MSIIPHLYDFESPFRMMEQEFFRPDNFFDSSPFHHLMPRGVCTPEFIKPWHSVFKPWANYIRPLDELSSAMNHLALTDVGTKISSDNEKFQVSVDVQHFSPEEINVKVIDGNVIIEGKHEEKRDQHGFISRQFIRRYALPQGCLPDTVESKLSSDGVLTVTAPKVLPLPSIGERIVPIAQTGPVNKLLGPPEPIKVE